MESALALVQQEAATHQARQVERIVLRVGALAGVDAAALQFAFDVVARGTLAERATLEIDAVPATAFCSTCQREFSPDRGFIFACPTCGELGGEIRRGRELELSRIEMS